MITTQAFRVVRVLGGHSPVARIDGVGEDGHEIRLEVSADAARDASPDQVLVVNWSLHALAPARPAKPELPARDVAEAPASATAARSVIDEEFMALMGRRPAEAQRSTAPTLAAAESPASTVAAMLGLKTE